MAAPQPTAAESPLPEHAMKSLSLLLGLSLLGAPATKPKPAPKKLDLGLGTMKLPDLPTGDGLKTNAANPTDPSGSPTVAAESSFEVTGLTHQKSQTEPLTRLDCDALPCRLPGFSSTVTLTATGRSSAEVAVRLLDPRGREVMRADGRVGFQGGKAAWSVTWDPTTVAESGSYAFVVELGGVEAKRFPMPVVRKVQGSLAQTAAVVDAGSGERPPPSDPAEALQAQP